MPPDKHLRGHFGFLWNQDPFAGWSRRRAKKTRLCRWIIFLVIVLDTCCCWLSFWDEISLQSVNGPCMRLLTSISWSLVWLVIFKGHPISQKSILPALRNHQRASQWHWEASTFTFHVAGSAPLILPTQTSSFSPAEKTFYLSRTLVHDKILLHRIESNIDFRLLCSWLQAAWDAKH